MQIKIGCVDGNTYISDRVDNKEVLAKFHCTGVLEGISKDTIDDVAEYLSDFVFKEEVDGVRPTSFRIVNGGKIKEFRISSIIWLEIDTAW